MKSNKGAAVLAEKEQFPMTPDMMLKGGKSKAKGLKLVDPSRTENAKTMAK